MADSVYKVTEVVGTSPESWEQAAAAAVSQAAKTIRDLRVGEITAFDVTIKDGRIKTYRAKVKMSFKYEA
jgi:dodecin